MIPDDQIVTHKSLSGLSDLFTRLDEVEARLSRMESILLANRNNLLENKEVAANPEFESEVHRAFYELRNVKRDGTPTYWGGTL
jgi:hypothetical protein